jgi:hypothetical protein
VVLEIVFQDKGAVVLLIARRVDEGDGLPPALLAELLDKVRLLPKFGAVALPELGPPGRVVMEPAA